METGVPITDKRGRGPSAQVNAAADRLEEYLAKRSLIRSVARAVVFSHDDSIIDSLSNVTVDLVATLPQLNRTAIIAAMRRSDLAGMTPAQVVELIRRDHEYHQRASELLDRRTVLPWLQALTPLAVEPVVAEDRYAALLAQCGSPLEEKVLNAIRERGLPLPIAA